MYESLLNTVFQSITYEASTISAYKMNVIRICHHSIICPLFPGEPDSYQLITFDLATQHRFYQLFITTGQKRPNPLNSTLSNIITKCYSMLFYKAATLENVPVSHVSALVGPGGCDVLHEGFPFAAWVGGLGCSFWD